MKKVSSPIRGRGGGQSGFTIIELIMVVATLAVLLTITIPVYKRFVEKARVSRATADIRAIEKDLASYFFDNDSYPASLAAINRDQTRDPWGNAYQYARALPGAVRQDAFGNDLNSDFDLYSLGADGASAQDITDPVSLDDILRTSDGNWVGPAEDY
ncbi:MAG: prepilin-type N-terminal cleavage/methylation domain-containing protein [Deltaproteobacteria bacterium]|nr:MAG: prepilin-type N-terminal cleavage/methylation domain-containing protein [Deltaproteobacteria bacterium]